MPDFAYTARTGAGHDVAGVISAASKREALRALGERALFPLRVETSAAAAPAWRAKRRIRAQLLATTLTQLADLLHTGVPLLRSLDVLAEQCAHPGLAEVLTDLRNQVSEGTSLDEALARHGEVFNDLTVSMVRAGSEGAFLEDALKRTADFLEKQEEMKGRVIGAMTYPAILAVAGVCVVTVLVVFFVPKFAELFAKLEERGGLPTATVWLLWLSDTLRSPWGLVILAALAGGAYAARRQLRNDRVRLFVDRWKLRVPICGPVFLGFAVSRFCRVLGTLLRNGVPILRSLEISSDSTGNRTLAEAIRASSHNISAGDTLAAPLAQCGLFPPTVMAMISVAEESNNLENVLVSIADGLDRDTNRRLDLMVRLVEPLMLLVMAGVILFVLVALLLPVFEMSSAVG